MEHKGGKGCDYKSHPPLDHSKSLNDFESMGIPAFAPYEKFEPHFYTKIYGEFEVKDFPLTTTDNRWTHTNADGSECPCYGFLITHPEMGRMI